MMRLPPLAAALASAFLLAACSSGSGGSSPLPPAVPSGLTGTAPTSGSITLSWTGSTAYTGYKVYRNGVEIASPTGTSFTDSGLSPSTAYQYYVRGVTSTGLSDPSVVITVTTPNLLTMNFAKLVDSANRSYMMVRDIEFDPAGNIYVAGGAFSSSFPTTPGAYDRTFGAGGASTGSFGPSDAYVMKFNRAGQLQWSTLVGGPNHDRAYGLAIAPDGGVIIAGRAGEGFPTTPGVVQPNFAGQSSAPGAYGKQDGFIAKLSADGSRLLWSTYIGDSEAGVLRDVAVDQNNKVYAVGRFSAGFQHITSNAVQTAPNGAIDLAYIRLNANATQVEYGTFIGSNEGSGQAAGTPSIVVAANKDVHVVVDEAGSGAPTTSNAFQRNNAGGVDLLVAKFNASDQLVFATYLGGSGDEALETHNIAIDSAGRIAIAAFTNSNNFPTTQGVYQPQNAGMTDATISILSPNGSSLVASTYFGGASAEFVEGVKFSPDGLLYFSGGAQSSSLRTTSNAVQPNFAGVTDAYLAALTPDLTGAPYVTYLGGSDTDNADALAIASDGMIAFGGRLSSPQFPVSGGGPTTPNGGSETGWWALFRP